VHGVSTRKVDDLLKALGLDGMSKSEVSRICVGNTAASCTARTRWRHFASAMWRSCGNSFPRGAPKIRRPSPAAAGEGLLYVRSG
jgi:hypothetical protein